MMQVIRALWAESVDVGHSALEPQTADVHDVCAAVAASAITERTLGHVSASASSASLRARPE